MSGWSKPARIELGSLYLVFAAAVSGIVFHYRLIVVPEITAGVLVSVIFGMIGTAIATLRYPHPFFAVFTLVTLAGFTAHLAMVAGFIPVLSELPSSYGRFDFWDWFLLVLIVPILLRMGWEHLI